MNSGGAGASKEREGSPGMWPGSNGEWRSQVLIKLKRAGRACCSFRRRMGAQDRRPEGSFYRGRPTENAQKQLSVWDGDAQEQYASKDSARPGGHGQG